MRIGKSRYRELSPGFRGCYGNDWEREVFRFRSGPTNHADRVLVVRIWEETIEFITDALAGRLRLQQKTVVRIGEPLERKLRCYVRGCYGNDWETHALYAASVRLANELLVERLWSGAFADTVRQLAGELRREREGSSNAW